MRFDSIIGASPYIELLARHLYWNSSFLLSNKNKLLSKKKVDVPVTISFSCVIDKLRERGVKNSDLLIVHSSLDGLQCTGVKPREMIDALLNLIGPRGTLAMPAFPKFKNEPHGFEIMSKDISDMVFEYDLKKTIAWTGAVPNALLRYPGSVRSKHPLNSMVAVGPLAEEMMADNLLEEFPYPCGPNSSWKFCLDRGAKILGIGVDLVHSLTMIHVAEDIAPEARPIDWYRNRRCIIIDGANRQEIVVQERHPKWSLHFAERTLHKDLLREKILQSECVQGVQLEMIRSAQSLLEFLNRKKPSGYPYFLLPKK